MKPFLSFALICMGLAACQSTYHQTRMSVDDDALVRVPVSDRDDINKARADCLEAKDRIEVAERDLANAKERLNQAQSTASMAHDEIDVAQKRCKTAENSSADARDAEWQSAREHCDGVCAHARWADAQVVYHEHVVEEMKGRVELEQQRAKLCEAQVELAKAKAVNAADKNDVDPYDIAAFESAVAAQKLEVDMAEVDRDAWTKKMKLCKEAVDATAKAVPASYGSEWRKTDDVPPAKEVK